MFIRKKRMYDDIGRNENKMFYLSSLSLILHGRRKYLLNLFETILVHQRLM